ncbi:hypothetical protein GCM10025762_35920 [Haloechinothrix salitolerans]
MRGAFDNAVLLTLMPTHRDPRMLTSDERARRIADAMASVDVDMIAHQAPLFL